MSIGQFGVLRMVVVAASLVIVLSHARAGPFEDGVVAYERQDYATALRLWQPLAEQGDAASQFNLGLMYDTGRGVPEDDATAVNWYRQAAEQQYAKAQFSLGAMYQRGDGVAQDFAQAAKWFRLAADQRNAKARYQLAYMYERGEGVPRDRKEGVKLFNQAAEQGLAEAQVKLGIMHAIGQGVPQDYQRAYMWLQLAAANSPPGATHDKAVASRDIIAGKMTPDQLASARKAVGEWRPKVAP